MQVAHGEQPLPTTLPAAGTTSLDFATGISNDYTGTTPTQYGLLSLVTTLKMHSNNGVIGTLPSELGGLTGMQTGNTGTSNQYKAFVRATGIGGTIPTELGNWVNMEGNFAVNGGTTISGSIPSQLGNMVKFTSRLLMDPMLYERKKSGHTTPPPSS